MARMLRRSPRTARPWLLLAASGVLAGACSGGGSTTGSGGNATTGAGASAVAGTGGATSSGTGAVCGNGVIEGVEECDDGAKNGTAGDPCKSDCSFVCIAGNPQRDHCDDGNACNGTETCGMDHVCHAGTPLMNGASCGTGKDCVNGNCVSPSCGDGVTDGTEECDDGNTVNGDGCDNTCKFSCLATDPARNCASTNPCVANGTCGANHVCTAGMPLANGTACPGGTCQAGTCIVSSCAGQAKCAVCSTGLCNGTGSCLASTCGDGCVDASKGEQCDPPNGTTCDSSCHLMAATCGNGVIEAGEQCDDGNKFNLDGCNGTCKYEAVARMTQVAISGNPAPSFCTPSTNRLGTQALTGTALGQLNPQLQNGINAGTTNIITQFLGLTDLTGVSSSPFTIGVLTGPMDPAHPGMWTGTSPTNQPIDWWFFANHAQLDAMGIPTGQLTNGMLSARNLTAGPSDVTLGLVIGGSSAALQMRSTHVAASFDGMPAPNVPAPPPSQLAAGLTVFQTITGDGTNQGLCGNITVASLAQIAVPAALAQGGSTACGACNGSHTYTACATGQTPQNSSCNSLLDVLVGGCRVVACLADAVNPTEPDVPATSGGTVQTLTLGAGNKVPNSVSATDNDAYSAFMTFKAERAHLTGETCSTTADCQTGKTCNTTAMVPHCQ